jgi:hypothetical protein
MDLYYPILSLECMEYCDKTFECNCDTTRSGVGWVGRAHQCTGNVDARVPDGGIVQPFGLGEAEKSVAGDVHFGYVFGLVLLMELGLELLNPMTTWAG